MPDAQEVNQQRQRTAEIVTAYVKHHKLSGDELVALISTVHQALAGASVEPEPERMPAVPIRQSVRQEYVVCLDCGWRGKMLGRHILSSHQLTRTEYRARWKLSPGHPLTAPGYSERRSQYAKQIGLGRRPQAQLESGGAEPEAAALKTRQRRKGASSRRRRQASAAPS